MVTSGGRYRILEAESSGAFGNDQTTLCYSMPVGYTINNVSYSLYCLELITSPAINFGHNGMGYDTAVLVRLVNAQYFSSILLGSVLAAPGHTFEDTEQRFTIAVESITSKRAILRIGVTLY
jgi:hypothetical protein